MYLLLKFRQRIGPSSDIMETTILAEFCLCTLLILGQTFHKPEKDAHSIEQISNHSESCRLKGRVDQIVFF